MDLALGHAYVRIHRAIALGSGWFWYTLGGERHIGHVLDALHRTTPRLEMPLFALSGLSMIPIARRYESYGFV